jgi:hypothetical protein
MCFSRKEWFEELARREHEEQELRDLLEREARRPAPVYVADADPGAEAEEREPLRA